MDSTPMTTTSSPKTTPAETIYFYKRGDPYYEFTNFAEYPIEVDGFVYPTNEHYYQASKFNDEKLQKTIRECESPGRAFKYGRSPKNQCKLRSDWDKYRLKAMKKVLYAKFTQHEALKQLLLGTGEVLLVEDSPVDTFWGCGSSGAGKNHLGRMLVELRRKLREEESSSP